MRRSDFERVLLYYNRHDSTFKKTLEFAYDLGRIAGLREAAKIPFLDRSILSAMANREARKLRGKR